MKRLSIIIMCFATMAFASCNLTNSIANSDSMAKANGYNTANAIVSLYNSYRATGNVSLSNSADLTNMLVVASGYTNIRNNKQNTSYMTAFATGMVSAGAGLITKDNVQNVINTMNGLTGLNVNAATISNNVGTVTAIIQLLQILNSGK